MAAKMSNIIKGFVIMWVLVISIVTFWGEFRTGYNLTDQQTDSSGKTVFEALKSINVVAGIMSVQEGLSGIFKPVSIKDIADLTGAMQLSGAGILQTLGGVVTFPFEISSIVTGLDGESGFYGGVIPAFFTKFLGIILVVSIAMILLYPRVGLEL